MKLPILREDLIDLLTPLKSLTAHIASRPTSGQVLVSVLDNLLSFYATNIDASVRTEMKVDTENSATAAVDFKRLYDVVKSHPKESVINLVLDPSGKEKKLLITRKSSRTSISVTDHRKFNYTLGRSNTEGLVLSCEALVDGLSRVEAALPKDGDNYRVELNQILLEPSGSDGFLRFVATDGIVLLTHLIPGVIDQPIAIRTSAVTALKDLMRLDSDSDCNIVHNGSTVTMDTTSGSISVAVSAKPFPNYQRIIPKGYKFKTTTSLVDFTEGLSRIKVGSESNQVLSVILSMKNGEPANLLGTSEKATSSEEVDMEYDYENMDMSLKFQVNKLLTVCKALKSESCSFEIVNEISPVILKSGNRNTMGLIMPMRQ